MRFDLYLESGPQHKRTWIYVPDLPGTSTVAPTSAEAPAAAEAAIGERLAFLRDHGETQLTEGRPLPAPAEPMDFEVAQHVIERQTLGFGQQFFDADLPPLARDDAARLLRWAEWSRAELVAAARGQHRPLLEKPASGRSAAVILSHVAGAEWAYVSSTLGTLRGGSAAVAAIEAAGEAPWEALAAARATVAERLAAISDEELSRVVEKNGVPRWTARRMFRRVLEHEWEHVLELRARL